MPKFQIKNTVRNFSGQITNTSLITVIRLSRAKNDFNPDSLDSFIPYLHICIFTYRDEMGSNELLQQCLNASKESLTKIDPTQLWKISGTTLISKTITWQSGQKWKFKPVEKEGGKIYIENTANDKVLATPDNYRQTEEAFDKQNARQKWRKGPADGEGFFTLENISSEKFLTATSKGGLVVKGN